MNRLQWSNISVGQFLDIYRLSINTSLDDMAKLERAVAILFDKTERQIDEMPMGEFSRLSAQCAFVLNEPVPGKPARILRTGSGKRYRITYNVSKLKHRQYVEVLHFGEKPVDNMHLIMASIVRPVRWGVTRTNKAEDHEAIASDMLTASVQDVYHSAVFFCNLYINSINSIRGYLETEMIKMGGMSPTKASEAVITLINAMAGYIPPKSLRILKT